MNKEYTYNIDKYTIGVDENGKDEIGLTIAIIKNGEINVLGNCYGENARCIDLLIKENQELKKQLKEWGNHLKCSKEMLDIQGQKGNYDYDEYMLGLYNGMEYIIALFETREPNYISGKDVKFTNNKTQQKEFIKYLEDEIYSIEPKGTGIIYNCEYDSEDDYVMAMREQSRLNTLKEILQKYKEIIGNDINVGSKGGNKDE